MNFLGDGFDDGEFEEFGGGNDNVRNVKGLFAV
jgi:hypothetical protein